MKCVNDDKSGHVYVVARGQGRALPVSLCQDCAEGMTFGDVVRLARSLHVRPAVTLRPTTLEAVEASKRAFRGGRGRPGHQSP